MHDMINVDMIILFRFILTQFIFSCLYIQHYYCVSVMAFNYVNVFSALNTQRTFFEDMSTFFLHDILRALQILLTVRLSGYV